LWKCVSSEEVDIKQMLIKRNIVKPKATCHITQQASINARASIRAADYQKTTCNTIQSLEHVKEITIKMGRTEPA